MNIVTPIPNEKMKEKKSKLRRRLVLLQEL